MNYYENHGHIVLGDGTLEEKFRTLRENNVVYFRDAGGHGLEVSKARDLAAENEITFKTPVIALYKEGLYGKFLGESFTDSKDFYKKVLYVKELGADFIKVMYSGIASFKHPGTLTCEPLSAQEIKEICKTVHGEGLKVMAHCNGATTIKYAIEYGTDSIEHGIFIDDEAIDMLRQSEGSTIWVPTIVAVTNEELQVAHKDSVKKAAEVGVKIACGSDSGASTVAYGIGTKLEAEALTECGALEEGFVCI